MVYYCKRRLIKPYRGIVPRAGQPSSEGKSAAGFFRCTKERSRMRPGEGSARERDEPVEVDVSHPCNGFNGLDGLFLFIICFEREPDNKIYNRCDTGIVAELRRPDCIGNRVAPVQPGEDCIAPGLGAEMQFRVRTVIGDQGKRLAADKFRPDFARECPEEDIVFQLHQEFFYLIKPRVDPVGAISKGIRRDKPYL